MAEVQDLERDVTLSFARVTVRTVEPRATLSGTPLVDVLLRALEFRALARRTKSAAGGPIRAFAPPNGDEFHFAPDLVGGSLILGEGETYTAVDRQSGSRVKETYAQPPLRGSSLFVIDANGWATIDKKETAYITPKAILELLATRIRESADESTYISVNTSLMGLHEDTEEVISFVRNLDTLESIELTGFSQPNPHEQSDVLERARRARIRRIQQSTDDPAGIDRKNELLEDELAHASHGYAKVSEAIGTKGGEYSGLRVRQDITELDVHIKGRSEVELLKRMYSHFLKLRQKLRPIGNGPL